LGSKFTIHTKDDNIKETLEEDIDLVGNIWWGETSNKSVKAKGTIQDNDNTLGVESIENASVLEGYTLYHKVRMSGISDIDEKYTFNIENLTTSELDYNSTPTFSQNVSYDGDMITVPRGKTEFYVMIKSNADTEYEPEGESYKLSIEDKEANGTIIDYKKPAVLRDDNLSTKLKRDVSVEINILANDDSDIEISDINLSSSVPGTEAFDTDGDGDIDKLVVPGDGTWSVDDEGILSFQTVDISVNFKTKPIQYRTRSTNGLLTEPANVVVISTNTINP